MKQFYSFDQDKWVWIPDTKKPLFYHSWQNSVISVLNIAYNTGTNRIGPHQILAAAKTLFQPGGGDYVLMSPPSFESHRRACNDQNIGIIIDISNLFTLKYVHAYIQFKDTFDYPKPLAY